MEKRIIIFSADNEFGFIAVDGIEEVRFPNKEKLVEKIREVYDETWVIEDKSRTQKIKTND